MSRTCHGDQHVAGDPQPQQPAFGAGLLAELPVELVVADATTTPRVSGTKGSSGRFSAIDSNRCETPFPVFAEVSRNRSPSREAKP